MASQQSKRDESTHDESKHDEDQERRERSFHWPPTTEELESIQVVAMSDLSREAQHRTPSHAMVRATLSQRTRLAKLAHDRDQQLAAPPPALASRRWFDGPVAAQAGLVAASLAAIGVAATSLLSPPQPVTSHAATKAPSAMTASAHAPEPAIAFPIAPVSPRSPEAQPTTTAARAASDTAHGIASTAASRPLEAVEPTPTPVSTRADARADARPLHWNWTGSGKASAYKATHARRGSAEVRPAGSDPVSRFATKTGSGVWKVMRAVGRSFKRSDEPALESRAPTRSASARRMAAAIALEAENDLSDR